MSIFIPKPKIIFMAFIIIGAVLAVIGFFLLKGSKKSAGHSLSIASTAQTNARNLLENYESMSNSFGKGNFNLYVKLYGLAHADKPLMAKYSKRECVYYHIEVDREYEKLETKTSKEGEVTKKWVRKCETILDKEEYAPGFAIKDEYGSIKINQNNAKLETIESYSEFEKEEGRDKVRFPFSFESLIKNTGPDIRTIGYTHVERTIPYGHKLFVVGNASDATGDLEITKSFEKNKPFIVSIKSEAEITDQYSKSSQSKKGWGYALIGIGIALLAYGIIQKLGLL